MYVYIKTTFKPKTESLGYCITHCRMYSHAVISHCTHLMAALKRPIAKSIKSV